MGLFDVYPLFEITPVRGEGVFVYDNKGREYLDLYGGHAVISIGHSHPNYVEAVQRQVEKLGFYSNSVRNPLQEELAEKLGKLSGFEDYQLFLCNSGAEANENALKLASFQTGRSKVLYFERSFHGRTSGAVAVTDNPAIQASYNQDHQVERLSFGDVAALEEALTRGDVAAVIFETIQGVGGLEEMSSEFLRKVAAYCKENGSLLIADEIQCGYGRTGDFFAFQRHGITPDIISMAKGMGNGFPIGGILIHPRIQSRHGLLGTTFGGNHLGCAAGIAVLETLEKEELIQKAGTFSQYLALKAAEYPQIKRIRGRGLMIGLEFDFEVASLRKRLLYEYGIFTGSASDKNLLRILPPLIIEEKHFEFFFSALDKALTDN